MTGVVEKALDPAQDAFNRMARAERRGTGCYLTAEMIQSLGVTLVGDIWSQPDPRNLKGAGA